MSLSSPFDPGGHTDPLHRLGLTRRLLDSIRWRTQQDVDTCTDLDPPGSRGTMRYMRTVRYLREELVPLGWRPDDSGNVGAIVNATGDVAIIVTAGDPNTGNPEFEPRTKYRKGEMIQRRVRLNHQLELFVPYVDQVEVPEPMTLTHTWVFLQYPCGDVVRAELSRPLGWDDTDRITVWGERIVLDELRLSVPEWGPRRVDDDDDGDDDYDVPVTRR